MNIKDLYPNINDPNILSNAINMEVAHLQDRIHKKRMNAADRLKELVEVVLSAEKSQQEAVFETHKVEMSQNWVDYFAKPDFMTLEETTISMDMAFVDGKFQVVVADKDMDKVMSYD